MSGGNFKLTLINYNKHVRFLLTFILKWLETDVCDILYIKVRGIRENESQVNVRVKHACGFTNGLWGRFDESKFIYQQSQNKKVPKAFV